MANTATVRDAYGVPALFVGSKTGQDDAPFVFIRVGDEERKYLITHLILIALTIAEDQGQLQRNRCKFLIVCAKRPPVKAASSGMVRVRPCHQP